MIFKTGWILTAAFFAGTYGAAPVQAKTSAPVKKAAHAKKATGPIVLGTTQMAGDFGKIGTTYTIGKSTPINFTLKSAEYSVVPFTVGLNTWQPRGDEKLLVLHYTVHNPMPREQSYSWSDLRFTAVDAKDTNHEFIQAVVREGDTQPLSLSLKPAQKLDVVTAIVVPAEGVVSKLIVMRESGAPVVRYALAGNVKPLPANVADASDASGATAKKEVAAQRGVFYATGVFDTRLDEVAYVDSPLLGREAGDNNRYITTIFTIKNRSEGTQRYVWSDFLPDLRDADGESARYTQALLKATRDESTYGELAPGEEARIRFFFPLPRNVAGKTLKLAEGKQIDARVARIYAFDLTDPAAK